MRAVREMPLGGTQGSTAPAAMSRPYRVRATAAPKRAWNTRACRHEPASMGRHLDAQTTAGTRSAHRYQSVSDGTRASVSEMLLSG